MACRIYLTNIAHPFNLEGKNGRVALKNGAKFIRNNINNDRRFVFCIYVRGIVQCSYTKPTAPKYFIKIILIIQIFVTSC